MRDGVDDKGHVWFHGMNLGPLPEVPPSPAVPVVRRAVWWARTWSLAYAWRRGFGMFGPNGNRARVGRTVLRSTRISLSGVQSWRVHKHEKQAWARLEELTQ